MRMAFVTFLLWMFAGMVLAQDARLPRTIKVYPFNLFRGEVALGYEHGITPRLSVTGQVSRVGTGSFSQVNGAVGRSAEACTLVWPTRGFSVKAGGRFYPSKLKRTAPFYVEGILGYRLLQFPEMTEYAGSTCEEPSLYPTKRIHPVVQRIGFQAMLGGAMRRDRYFTVDIYGGLGLHAMVVDENQAADPGLPDDFYRIEPVRTRPSGSIHLGFSLGFNLHGTKKR